MPESKLAVRNVAGSAIQKQESSELVRMIPSPLDPQPTEFPTLDRYMLEVEVKDNDGRRCRGLAAWFHAPATAEEKYLANCFPDPFPLPGRPLLRDLERVLAQCSLLAFGRISLWPTGS